MCFRVSAYLAGKANSYLPNSKAINQVLIINLIRLGGISSITMDNLIAEDNISHEIRKK